MATAHEGKPARMQHIDAMRGIAALLVVFAHNLQPVATGTLRMVIYEIIDPGKVGVVIFFAISGFVIPFSFPNGPAPLPRFMISRLFRLYPAYWLSMAAWIALVGFAGASLPSIRTVLANVTMVQPLFGQPNVLGVYWTLFIELIFYGLCAIAFALGLLRISRFSFGASLFCLLVAVLFAAARFMFQKKVPVALPLSLSIMFWGTLWREATIGKSQQHRRFAAVMLVLFVIAIPPISLLAYDFDTGLEEHWTRYTISYYLGLAAFMLFSTRVKITAPAALWSGQISYALYLFHVHSKMLVDQIIAGLGSALPITLEIAISIAVAIGIAYLVFSLVERPAIRIGKALGAKVAAGRAASPIGA